MSKAVSKSKKATKAAKPTSVRRTASLPVRARYDAAQTTANNRRYYVNADALSANASNSPEVRAVLRSRARYEVDNNSWAKGMSLTLAKSIIGKGPRLQMNETNRTLNRLAELEWIKWSRKIRFGSKLRTMRKSRLSDGEAFGIIGINKGLSGPINVDLRLIEADQVGSPERSYEAVLSNNEIVDGIEYDSFGNETYFHILQSHPGSESLDLGLSSRRIAARQIIHWQREDRAGLHRATPEITPALPLFGMLRRHALAVVDAAETAADYAVLFSTTLLGQDATATEVPEASEFGEMELARRMGTFLPEGWTANQMKAEQPTTVYDEFTKSILNEVARCLEMPLNIAIGNSGGYNMASGKLDGTIFRDFVDVERDDSEIIVVDRMYDVFISQLALLPEFAEWRGREDDLKHQYFWDGRKPVDPTKQSTSEKIDLSNGSTNLAEIQAGKGRDWEPQQEQGIREKLQEVQTAKDLASEYDLTPEEAIAIVTKENPISIFIEEEKEPS